MSVLPDPFDLEFMQRAGAEMVLLAPLAGLLGTQIVLRGLAFYTHGVGTAAFPGLVVAGPLGVPAALAGLVAGLGFAALVERLGRARRMAADTATAMILVGALAVGIVLASDVFDSGSEVDQLLFGSLLAIGDAELATTAVALVVVAAAALLWRRAWIAAGFDPASSRSLGLPVATAEWGLLVAVAIAVVAALDAVGALLVGAILVIPAATARLFASGVGTLELWAAAIALVEGILGLWIAFELDVPPGAAIATLSGCVFAAAALARAAGVRVRTAAS
jgi:manganese/iron transport system permease protein